MAEIDLIYLIGLPPREAIRYLRDKGYQVSWNWQEVWQKAHARAFTVAKAMKLDILQDIRDAILAALAEGKTYREFRQEIEPELRKKGWWGKVRAGDVPGFDPAGGQDPEEEVQLGSPWRLRTIYGVNMQTSWMAGRYDAQIQNTEDRPYWMYVAVMDTNTRPSHAALNGKIFRFDDPFWDTFYPPNGWNCRCRVRTLSEKNIIDRGLAVEDSAGRMFETDQVLSKRTGETIRATGYRAQDGNKQTWVIPDPGWGYNPGKAAFEAKLSGYDPELRKAFENDPGEE